MPTDSLPSFESIFAALGRKLDADPELQRLVSHALARFAAGVVLVPGDVEPVQEEPTNEIETTSMNGSIAETAAVSRATDQASAEDLGGLAEMFRSAPPLPLVTTAMRRSGPATLAMIKERLNIKLKALNLARERAEAKARGERVYATGEWYKDAISQAKTKPNCYLWMCTTQRDNVMPVQWAEVHECFTVLLRALTLVQDVLGTKSNQSLIRNAMQLLAEAQSAVRVVCDRFDDEDGDQLDVYLHLLEWSAAEQVYIARYMKSDDFADPAQSRDLLRRVNDCARDLTEVNAAWQLRENLIKKIRYEANSLTKSPLNPLENWRKIIASVDQLIVSVTARAI